MAAKLLGELVPVGGGDAIPLMQDMLTIGRRESCDICLRFQNVSGQHCELSFRGGIWYVQDLGSSNGVKINGGERITSRRPLKPGDELGLATHKFKIAYTLAADADDAAFNEQEDIFGQSLMEKAGLAKPKRPAREE